MTKIFMDVLWCWAWAGCLICHSRVSPPIPPRYRNPAWMGWPCLVWLSTISQRALNIFAIKTNGANSANIMHMNLRTVTPRWSSTPLQCHKMFSNSKGLYASPSLFSRVLRAAERVRRYNFKQLAKYPRVLGAI